MSHATYTLWCLIEGDEDPLTIEAPINVFIDNLKILVKERERRLEKVYARELVLWKVRCF